MRSGTILRSCFGMADWSKVIEGFSILTSAPAESNLSKTSGSHPIRYLSYASIYRANAGFAFEC